MDGQEGSLELASRLSFLLMELCEVKVILLLARAITLLFSLDLHMEINFWLLKNRPPLFEGYSCDWL